ncbi:hypothetical protein CORC01_09601 [Colletotrichum orchidophilum]|uniref:Uncharacterized protein n=1 Tax=Colletotrichum orchidophilum TaxID=1209926 RepID=A0A1G4B122_9PEZI|nr:uncharacterized protein CORC01_09601 [Colletotrichum orchidophilum]OHE95077.1 hypothetical protein CORC01_09601 [Colletotrichum orchidophilum]
MAPKPKKTDSSQLSRLRSDSSHSPALTSDNPRLFSSSAQTQPHQSTPRSDEAARFTPLSRLFRRNRTSTTPNDAHQLALEASLPIFEPNSPAPAPAPAPPLPTPLLAGCPGREITGAKSNGREWACDLDEPPVLGYSEELSKTEFHEHPLAHYIELEKGWEKHQLALYGLILPAKVENGTPIYTWESDPEDEEDMDKALVLSKEKRQPSKPGTQGERPRTPSNILHKVKSFATFIAMSDVEKDVPELPTLKELLDQFGLPPATPHESAPRSFLRPTRSSSSLRPKTPTRSVPSATKLRYKRSAGIERSQISNPIAPEEMRRVGSDFSQAMARRSRNVSGGERDSLYASSLRSPSNLISPSISSSVPLYLLQPQHPTIYFGNNEAPPEFWLAPPRLSPMEYARQYLIAKANADREQMDCTVRKPGSIWAWTEDFKEFLLLPQLPAGLERNFLPTDGKHWKLSKMAPSSNHKDAGKRSSFIPLFLDLGPSSPLMPAHFHSNSYSFIGPGHKYRSSSDGFSLNRPASARYESLLQSTRLLLNDPSTPIANEDKNCFTEVFAPQFMRRQKLQHTLDDALTPQVEDETFYQSMSDNEADIEDTSSIYSQDSAVTAVRHPLTGCRPPPTDLMLLAPTTSEFGNEESLTPRQEENLPSNVAHSQERASRRSPVLQALSYTPRSESAQSYATHEQTYGFSDNRYSQAPSSTISNFSSQATGPAVDQHNRYSAASQVSSATSVSTSASFRLPIQETPAFLANDYAKASRKYARHAGTEKPAPETSSRITHSGAKDPLPPSRSSVTKHSSSSSGLPTSVTSLAADSGAYYREKRLPKRPEPAQRDPVTEAIESRNSNLPSLHVRRRRAVPSLPQISASQAYPKPLRLSTMKSPGPASTAANSDRAVSAASTGTVVPSTSRLIADIGNELDREMEEVLSPRSAALAQRSMTPKNDADVATPTRRPRQVQSMKSIPFDAPPLPAPNKPLPSIPRPKSKPEAAGSAFIDANFGPGPARSYVPARPPPPIPVLKPIDTTSPSAFDTSFDDAVTRADFSIKRDRTVRPAVSMAAMSPRPTPLVDQRQQRAHQQGPAAYVQKPANVPSRFLGKMASMAELKHRRDTNSSRSTDSENSVGMRTFLSEDSAAPAAAPSSSRDKSMEGSKRKFLSNLFKRNRKDGEK